VVPFKKERQEEETSTRKRKGRDTDVVSKYVRDNKKKRGTRADS
jgi:hypothetical protein